jgi:hypothetical protein
MLKFNKLFLLTYICVLASLASGQRVLDKPVDEWSKADAMEVLNRSAWAQIYQSTEGVAAASAAAALRDQSDNRLAGSERGRTDRSGGPSPILFRLHSGLPIRLALTRLNQIGAGYDKMNDKAKSEFNQSARKLLECIPCQNYYVVSITQFPNPSGDNVEEGIFQAMTLQQMKGNVWLKNEKGETREVVEFIAPKKRGDSAVFFFARMDDKGKILINKDNKTLTFAFNQTFLTSSNRFGYLLPRQLDFKVSAITVGDLVVF